MQTCTHACTHTHTSASMTGDVFRNKKKRCQSTFCKGPMGKNYRVTDITDIFLNKVIISQRLVMSGAKISTALLWEYPLKHSP